MKVAWKRLLGVKIEWTPFFLLLLFQSRDFDAKTQSCLWMVLLWQRVKCGNWAHHHTEGKVAHPHSYRKATDLVSLGRKLKNHPLQKINCTVYSCHRTRRCHRKERNHCMKAFRSQIKRRIGKTWMNLPITLASLWLVSWCTRSLDKEWPLLLFSHFH